MQSNRQAIGGVDISPAVDSLQRKKLLGGQFNVIENRFHQTRANDFAGLYRYNRTPSVGMFQKMMTALDPYHLEGGLLQRGDHLVATAAREFRHG